MTTRIVPTTAMATVVIIQPRDAPARLGRRTFERIRARLYLLGFGLAMAAVRLPVRDAEPGAGRASSRRRTRCARPVAQAPAGAIPCARPVSAAAVAATIARAPRNPAAAGRASRRGPVHHLSR